MFAAVRSEGARRIAEVQTAQHYFEILDCLELPRFVGNRYIFFHSYESKYATAAGSKGTTATGNLPKLPHALATEPTNDPVHPTAAPTKFPTRAVHVPVGRAVGSRKGAEGKVDVRALVVVA